MSRTARAIVLAGLAGLAPTLALAEPPCGPRETLMRELAKTYGEAPSGRGLTREGALLELFSSDRGTWTMVLSSADGRACVLAAGERWRATPLAAGQQTQ